MASEVDSAKAESVPEVAQRRMTRTLDKQVPQVNTSPDEMAGALYARLGREKRVEDQRTFERKAWVTHLTIWVESDLRSETRARPLEVVTLDVSRGGFCFVTRRFLFPGTTIRTRFNALKQRPTIRGMVRNCTHIGAGQHRVGVQFISVTKEASTNRA